MSYRVPGLVASILRPFGALVCLALTTVSCKDSTEPLRAVSLAVVVQPPGSVQSGVPLASAPVVELRDRNGATFAQPGVAITASIASGGGTLGGATTQSTDGQGRAIFPGLTIGGLVGPRVISFTASGLTSTMSASVAVAAGPAATLAASSVTSILATVNTAVTPLPAVVVTDASGNAISGVAVTFSVPGGAGNITGGSATTNAAGIANLGSWTLPTTAGQYTLTATVAGISGNGVAFMATAKPDAPAQMTRTAGDGQSVLYGSMLPAPLEVRVVDQYGNPTPGVVVTWGSFTGAGTVAPINVATDADGIVKSSYRLGTAPGANVIRASISSRGLTTDFDATALGFTEQFGVSAEHTCGLDTSGVLYCWGENQVGQLGLGSTTNQSTPKAVGGALRFKRVTVGNTMTCAITTNDVPYCWGSNSFGELGDGTQTARSVPTPVIGGHTFSEISSTGQLTCALTSAGAAYCWGYDSVGQLGAGATAVQTCPDLLGNPDFACSLQPVAVDGGLTFTSIAASAVHACALTAAGELYCWGIAYAFGASGGSGIPSPVRAAASYTFSEVTANAVRTCGIVSPSSAYCWGDEGVNGELGDGHTDTTVYTPVQLSGISAMHISAGIVGSCATATDGRGFCWGYNEYGAVGDGTTTSPRLTPTVVVTGQSLTRIRSSGKTACGRNAQGQLYCWGENFYGQLGVGDVGSQSTPALVRP